MIIQLSIGNFAGRLDNGFTYLGIKFAQAYIG